MLIGAHVLLLGRGIGWDRTAPSLGVTPQQGHRDQVWWPARPQGSRVVEARSEAWSQGAEGVRPGGQGNTARCAESSVFLGKSDVRWGY